MSLTLYWKLYGLYRWYKGGMEGMDTSKLKDKAVWIAVVGVALLKLLEEIEAPKHVSDTVTWLLEKSRHSEPE